MICGRCEFMSPIDGACRLPSSGRQVVAYFQEACEAKNTQNDNDMEETKFTKVCNVCGREKPIVQFAKNRWGYTNTCKDCMKAKKAGKKEEKKDEGLLLNIPKPENYEKWEESTRKWTAIGSTPDEVLVEELRRRGWSGTIVKHYELTI